MLLDLENSPQGQALLDGALEGMILSASGWRGVFAAAGGEESAVPEISAPHRLIAAAAAGVFADWLESLNGGAGPEGAPSRNKLLCNRPLVVVGTDTRPTGPAIADTVITALLGSGCAVRYAGVTAAPEIMAYTRSLGAGSPGETGPATGFIFISASHNPIGHNGLKFGLADGGVLPGSEAALLIEEFRALTASPDRIPRIAALLARPGPDLLERVYRESPENKRGAYSAYLDFTTQVVYGDDSLEEAIREGVRERALGFVCDFNGSARTLSIDREFLGSLGVDFHAINDKPGGIAHRIVPEGESLEPCRLFLEELHRKDASVILGYVPDCDGDRGNLVIWDEAAGRARSLEAQEVFALACVAELAHLVWTGQLGGGDGDGKADGDGKDGRNVALAVNDPTSLRIDRIAGAFGAELFRAEVGEANVVSLARKLREQGYIVRILGEGSAGGNITHPSAVRDPINTVLSLLKLLAVRRGKAAGNNGTDGGGKDSGKGFFRIWLDRSGRGDSYQGDFSLSDVIASLPRFATTGAYESEAVLRVSTADHGLLKDRYQTVFLREWENRKAELEKRCGIAGWEAEVYNGTVERRGVARFGEAGRGGLKINFLSRDSVPVAAIWMRGSATEPVFRIMADVEIAGGRDESLERDLISWQRHMVCEADRF
jgi:phosphoglucomutase